MKRRRAQPTSPEAAVAARKAAEGRRAEKRHQKAAGAFLGVIARRRLSYVASLLDFARAAADCQPGYDGAPPIIVDAPEPGDNPQLRVSRNLREHPLDLMFHKRQITPEQYGAGEMYRRDLEMEQISPMSGRHFESIYTVELSNAKAVKEAGLGEMMGPKTFAARRAKHPLRWDDLRPAQLDAMDRVNKARRDLEQRAGKTVAVIVTLFCRDRMTVQEIAAGGYGHRNGVGKKLQTGLDALAEHYGLKRRARGGGIRAWGDGSHVPSADGVLDDELEAAE